MCISSAVAMGKERPTRIEDLGMHSWWVQVKSVRPLGRHHRQGTCLQCLPHLNLP